MVKKHIVHRMVVVALLLAAFCVPFAIKHGDLPAANADADAYASDAFSYYGSHGASSQAQAPLDQSMVMDTTGSSFVGSSLQH